MRMLSSSYKSIFLTAFSRYAKAYDPDNWVTIDDKTAEIRLIKTPDRESKFLVNGTYFAKILVITQGTVRYFSV